MKQNIAWDKFAASGKVSDYLEYKKACIDVYQTFGDILKDADKNRRIGNKTTENS